MKIFILLLFLLAFGFVNAQTESQSTTVKDSAQTVFIQEMIYNSGTLRKQILEGIPAPQKTDSPYNKSGRRYGSIYDDAQSTRSSLLQQKKKAQSKSRKKQNKKLEKILIVPAAIGSFLGRAATGYEGKKKQRKRY